MTLRHIVLFGFVESASGSDVAEIVRRFAELPELVPGIEDFEWGLNNSPEDLDQGLTHCFSLSFDSTGARDAYLHHAAHVDFADWVGRWVEHVTVVDYWATPTVNQDPTV